MEISNAAHCAMIERAATVAELMLHSCATHNSSPARAPLGVFLITGRVRPPAGGGDRRGGRKWWCSSLCERHIIAINSSRARLGPPRRFSRPRPRARGALRACGRHAPERRGAQGMPRRARSVAPGQSNPGQIKKIPRIAFGCQTFITPAPSWFLLA